MYNNTVIANGGMDAALVYLNEEKRMDEISCDLEVAWRYVDERSVASNDQ